jgi:hypothetical protein
MITETTVNGPLALEVKRVIKSLGPITIERIAEIFEAEEKQIKEAAWKLLNAEEITLDRDWKLIIWE